MIRPKLKSLRFLCVANHQLLVVWARFLLGLQVNLMRIRTGAKRPIDLPKLIATQIGEVNRSLRSRSDSQIWLRLQPRCVLRDSAAWVNCPQLTAETQSTPC